MVTTAHLPDAYAVLSGVRADELRVVVVAPTGRDAVLTHAILQDAGIESITCDDVLSACAALTEGAAALLMAEEAVVAASTSELGAWLSHQPPWSDLPILVLARSGADSAAVARAMDLLGNVTVLERPIRIASLVSAVRTANRARLRQYQIREHLAERERAERALREADVRKNEFLAVLAHELRNPLAPIRNALHVLRNLDDEPEEAGKLAAIMDRQVAHLVRLVDDLLEISRITRDRLELRREHVTLRSVLNNAVDASRSHIEARQHRLDVQLPKDPITLNADPVRLSQVFTNLLNNAAKYTAPGGCIWLSAERAGDQIEVCVRDDGFGIPADRTAQIFDLFVQLDRKEESVQSGLGVGLTLVKRLVEMHDGSVEVRSGGLGHGAEFRVTLPCASETELAPPTAVEEHQPAPPPRSVLVVDDNVDAADTLALVLELGGARVRVAYSGPDALRAFDEETISVAFVDIGMPGMDGYEVARRVRKREALRDVTLVALTGWGQQDDIMSARAAGFDHHLLKPADLAELRNLLTNVADARV